MGKHIGLDELLPHAEGLLTPRRAAAIDAHLATCPACRALAAGVLSTLLDPATPLAEADTARTWQAIDGSLGARGQFPLPVRALAPRRRALVRRALAAAASLALAAGAGALFFRGQAPLAPYALEVARAAGTPRCTADGEALAPVPGLALSRGVRTATDGNSSIDIRLAGTSGFRLLPGSTLTVTETGYDTKSRRARVRLALDGTLVARVDKGDIGLDLEITTTHATLSVTGTRFLVKAEGGETRVVVFQGTVRAGDERLAGPVDARVGKGGTRRAAPDAADAQLGRLDRLARELSFVPGTPDARGEEKKRAPADESFRERLHLADGTVVTGTIQSQERDRVVIRTEYGTIAVEKTRIKRIEYLKGRE